MFEILVDAGRFSAAHFIPGHPKCGRLHGHNYDVSVKIRSSYVDDAGMIVDFGAVKLKMLEILTPLDHKILIPEKSSSINIKARSEHGSEVIVVYNLTDKKSYTFPVDDVAIIATEHTTVECLAKYIRDSLVIFGIGGPRMVVCVRESPTSVACHGWGE